MRARLVYDGDCGFCRYTVEYARAITGDAVDYRSYQEVAHEHPELSESEFAASIQLFTDAGRSCGARAAFETLALGGRRLWIALYRRVPGMAAVFEWLYRHVSRHRELSYRVARPLFGRRLGPRSHLQTADFLYRGIMLCGLIAFASFWWQAPGLVGVDGVLPLAYYLDAVAAGYGTERYWLLPTLFWLDRSDLAIHLVCGAGVLATAVGTLGRLRFSAAAIAYVCYLSLVHGGQEFMAYQWDLLLTECFVLAAVLARAPTLGVWLGRLLLFRFMLLSGAVKLLSGDPTWADATALGYHFESQPLPTLFAWYAHQSPAAVLEWGVHLTFAIELVLPFFVFLPRNLRLVAGAGFVALELLILVTGSYNFFNLLTLVLCISLLDDGVKRRLRGIAKPVRRRWGASLAAVLIIVQGLVVVGTTLQNTAPPAWWRATSPFLIANRYGLFAVMTTDRHELVVEGSMDGSNWIAYGFPFKPGPVDRLPHWAAPHQPRLDWQMWFAVLGSPERAPWIHAFVFALLEARPAVLALIDDPFNGERPKLVRILRYRYGFTDANARAASGEWWQRGPPTTWLGPVALRKTKITHGPLTLDDPGD